MSAPTPGRWPHSVTGENSKAGVPPWHDSKQQLPSYATEERHSPDRLMGASRKLGYMTIGTLIICPLLILAAMAWIAFLWFASNNNGTRRLVLIENWLTRSVTVCTLVIRTAAGWLSGIGTAMLAALALEHGAVLLLDAAAVSIVRAAGGSGSLAPLLAKFVNAGSSSFAGVSCLGLGAVLLVTTTAIQFSSVILMSDVQVVTISGRSYSSSTAYGFNYTGFDTPPHARVEMRVGTWFRKPPFYPTFAEYHEDPIVEDGVSDTGLTLRALLPSLSASYRETLEHFSGPTTVLDTRVTCQRPHLVGLNASLTPEDLNLNRAILLNGQVWSNKVTPRLVNYTTQYDETGEIDRQGVWFSCFAANNASHDLGAPFASDLLFYQWRTSICQLGTWSGDAYGGGLSPEFLQHPPSPRDFESVDHDVYNSTTHGSAYLVLNVTSGFTDDWETIPDIFTGVTPASTTEREEWVDLHFAQRNTTLSVTLCYTAFGSTEEPVTMTGNNTNRTEPEPGYDSDLSLLTFRDIRRQLLGGGQQHDNNLSLSLSERGLLSLQKNPSWLSSNNTQTGRFNYIEMFADGAAFQTFHQWGASPNFTIALYDWRTSVAANETLAVPEKTHVHLFQEIVTSPAPGGGGGKVAHALQAILTILGSMAYYDQILQFDLVGQTEQTFLVPANYPTTYRGFVIVSAALALHLFIVMTITFSFWMFSSFCSLDSAWQAIAHIVTPDTQEILLQSSDHPTVSERQVRENFKGAGYAQARVEIGLVDEVVVDAGAGVPGIHHCRVGLRRAAAGA
ncbi:hypothetical protein V8F06_002029 [Rhypophila decipiens]